MAPPTPIARESVCDRVRRAITDRIVDGSYPPGTRLRELVLGREFGVSQASVREALRDLESEQLVQTESYRGTRVRAFDGAEVRQTYAVRAVVEGLAGTLAAAALAARPEAIGRLRHLAGEIARAARANDAAAYARHDFAFHGAIVESAGNPVLSRTWQGLASEVRIRVFVLDHLPANIRRVAAEHLPIVDALAAGDGDTAGRLLRDHLDTFAAKYKPEPVPDPRAKPRAPGSLPRRRAGAEPEGA